MSEVLFVPEDGNPGFHDCDLEMPGRKLKLDHKYHPEMIPGSVIECTCGKIYRARDTGYRNLGCTIREVGYWEARRYRKNKVNY